MKKIKNILLVSSTLLLICGSSFASTYINQEIKEDKLIQKYEIAENQENSFIENIDKEIELNGEKFIYQDYTTEGGRIIDGKQITTSKTISSNTNNINTLKEKLGETIDYNENGYIGTYLLDIDSIKINTINNGYYEKLIDENIEYTNLEKNDLDYISKTIEKDGQVLNLLKTEWQVQTTKNIGDYEVPDLYIAQCYYATKIRVDYPDTYKVTAIYNGTATKTIENPITITINYKKQIIPVQKEEKNNPVGIIVGTGGAIVVFVLFIFLGNVTVYNMKDGKWRKIGKVRMNKGTIKLDRFELVESTNRYKIEFSKKLTNKMKDKLITVKKGKNSLKHLVKTDSEKYIFETRI